MNKWGLSWNKSINAAQNLDRLKEKNHMIVSTY